MSVRIEIVDIRTDLDNSAIYYIIAKVFDIKKKTLLATISYQVPMRSDSNEQALAFQEATKNAISSYLESSPQRLVSTKDMPKKKFTYNPKRNSLKEVSEK